MRAFTIVAAALLASAAALADEGEASVTATVALEGTTPRHPEAIPSAAPPSFAPAAVVGLGARYGVTNVVDTGLAVEAAFARNVATPRASLGRVTGSLITGLVVDARLPFAVGARFETGLPLSAGVMLEGGPSLELWSTSAFVDGARRDAHGLPVRLPIAVRDEVAPGVFLSLKLPIGLRPFNELAFAIEPGFSLAWAGSLVATAGVALRATWLPDVGPL